MIQNDIKIIPIMIKVWGGKKSHDFNYIKESIPNSLVISEISLKATIAQIPETLFYLRDSHPEETFEMARKRHFVELSVHKNYPFLQRVISLLRIIKKSDLVLYKKFKLYISVIEYHRIAFKIHKEIFKLLNPIYLFRNIKKKVIS